MVAERDISRVVDVDESGACGWNEVETYDRNQLELDWRQLEDFRRGDFRAAMTGELGKVFRDSSKIHLRHLALVGYYCRTKGRQYVRDPLRDVTAGSPSQASKLLDVYAASNMNAALQEAQQRALAANSVIMSFDTTPTPQAVEPISWSPADVIVHGDPMLADIRDADAVEIRCPVRRDVTDGTAMVWYGRRVYTRDLAYIEAPGAKGARVGLFAEDFRNPLGYIPLASVRLESPLQGLYHPHPPGDLLSVQIGTIIAASDMETIARYKAFPREAVTGGNAVKAAAAAEVNPWSLMGLQGNELEYQAISLDPRINRYIEAIEWTLRQWAQFQHINTEPWNSTGITGAAKEIERDAEVQDQYRHEQIWRQAEQQIAEVVADVEALGPSALAVEDPSVTVDYRYLEARQNDLQEAQSVALLSALGLESLSGWIAQRDGITLEAAAERLIANLEERKDVLESWRPPPDAEPPPGLDAIAAQTLK